MKQILITGGSGFVGTRLLDIVGDDYGVLNLDKRNSDFYPSKTLIGNILDHELLDKALKGVETVVHLAAEHRDDVTPTSLYYDVNVDGTRELLKAMDKNNVRNIIFTSSVAVYGLNKDNPNETHEKDPFNHYGKSKSMAEEVLLEWHNIDPANRSLVIIRPTVIFGERNRGNVYNLLKQISSGRFLMVGKGNNKKSMSYVGNIVSFIKYQIDNMLPGSSIFNYVDKPDFTMNELVGQVELTMQKTIPSVRIPYGIGLLGGYGFDVLSKLTGKKYAVSSVRVKKFCATTQFDATKAHTSGFKAPFKLSEGLHLTLQHEFIDRPEDEIVFESE
jgi:nucleoside-diphosphate-sugar epimerase